MPTPRNSKPKVAVVYNPIKVDLAKLKKMVTAAAKAADWAAPIWFSTTVKDAGQNVTGSAIRRGATVVIAAGGDGTVRAVAEALGGSGVAMAVVSAGTGNLLARNLELPTNSIRDSIELAFHGADHAIDLGMVEIVRDNNDHEKHAFLVMAGLGLDARMIKNTSTKLKKAVGWLAYVDGIARSIPELRPVKLRYSVDGGPNRSLSAHTVIIGNCGSLPGGLLLLPEAQPDDGILDMAALVPRGRFGWLNIWNKIAWENGVLRKSVIGRRIIDLSKDVRDVRYAKGSDLNMIVDTPEEFQLDGDDFGLAKSVHAWVEPGALIMRVPKVHTRAEVRAHSKAQSQARTHARATARTTARTTAQAKALSKKATARE
ncbi:NAD(+)/NADH kinase [Salinibacterium sp. NSLL150]|uniref:diacylglycerol/lipid kinase family protein n=1 Tax=unclassified Salinibacterium TaxID=2632331 RepID=UPI0018CD50ED|nr:MULTISPECIES: diacylglycerol kinase family protein [unclassified Salinibacterium]MBH0022555.1 NAD(+)/NADH kinase [Salinibacterium sp. SWN248]MBH0097559.1 NAD(+)/NADH kinase [Salinibacterium sp. NSLL35]MBH0100314.1 NAD(+)/NADH kinase [Salinibacterium sp. NSLL150]MBH0103073.1 NAD(+)/NADH kinase [Salinibacterium sp. NSLL16]MBH0105834.1 NAD(+)/NADH kinase [Salinibacterium sp. NSLL17]